MASVDTTKPQEGQPQQFDILPTDNYIMKIVDSRRVEDTFNPRDDGTLPEQLLITWEVERLSEDQDDEEIAMGTRVFQRLNPWYGITKKGAPSKYKQFVDGLIDQGLLEPQFDDEEDLVGIVQRVNVEKYIKTMGSNKGQPGNRVLNVMPLKTRKPKPAQQQRPVAVPELDDDELGF